MTCLRGKPRACRRKCSQNKVGTTGTSAAAQSVEPTAWITFAVLCISAIAALLGGVVGRQRTIRPLV